MENGILLTIGESCVQHQVGMDAVTIILNYNIKSKLQRYVPVLTYYHTSGEKVP